MKVNQNLAFELAVYGVVAALLLLCVKFFEVQFMTRKLALEVYLGLVALLFAGFGIWLGHQLVTGKKVQKIMVKEFVLNKENLTKLDLTDREYEVLQLMGEGKSNQEIANALFLSIHTIKSHAANLYSKLGVKRRTQALQKARELGVLA